MDIFALVITTLMALVSPTGLVVDSLAEDALRRQVASADELYVRVDNVPNYQIVSGRIDQVRIASRGLYTRQLPDLRIEAIDLETDVVDVDLGLLRQGQLKLDHPAQAALRLQLRDDDLNTFIRSPLIQAWLDTLEFNLGEPAAAPGRKRYGLVDPSLEFLAGDRFRITLGLEDRVLNDTIPVVLEAGLGIVNGHRFELIDPKIEIDGEEAPPQLITSLAEGASQEFTLRRLEAFGLTARILNFVVRDKELDIAIFARLEPNSPFLVNSTPPPGTDGEAVLPSPQFAPP